MKYINEFIGLGGIRVRTVADSFYNGSRIATIETYAPKFIDAEFEKHRQLSSCSSSTRAIPFDTSKELYIPADVRCNQRGMQGYQKIPALLLDNFQEDVKEQYKETHDRLSKYKDTIHKQHLGRYLEPWTFQTKVVTATQWGNFFKLRLANDVQPEMHEVARLAKLALTRSAPVYLKPGEWHLPYALTEEGASLENLKMSSSAGCARASYGVAGGKEGRTLERDLKLAKELLDKNHRTPFEHQAKPIHISRSASGEPILWQEGVTHMDRNRILWSGNFKGWIQNRQLLEDWTNV